MTTVAVQLVTWNGAAQVHHCLSSLAAQVFRHWTLHGLDNGSPDGTAAILQRWLSHHPGTMERLPTNVGFAKAHNLLLRAYSHPYVLILNQDVTLHPDYLAHLIGYLKHHPNVGSVSGVLFRTEDLGSPPTGSAVVDSAGLTISRTHRVVERQRGQPATLGATESVFGVPATAALYRRRALEETALRDDDSVEYFDEHFFSYKEDVDLAYRLQLRGWGSACLPTARGYHVRGLRGEAETRRSVGTLHTLRHRRKKSSTQNYLSYRNHLFFLFSTFGFPAFSTTWWATLGYETVKILALLLSEPTTLRAWREVWKERPWLREKRRQVQAGRYQVSSITLFF